MLGVSAATLSAIENGKTGISSERLAHLATALEVSVERLLAESAADHEPAPPLRAADRPDDRRLDADRGRGAASRRWTSTPP